MVQKGQKQEGLSCGEVFAVCDFHTQGYCIYHILTSGSMLHHVLLTVWPHKN